MNLFELLRINMGLCQHQGDQGIRGFLIDLCIFLDEGRYQAFRGQVGPADRHGSQGAGVPELQQQRDDPSVAVPVQSGLVKPQPADHHKNVVSHVGIMVLLQGSICPVSSGIRGIDVISGFRQLGHFHVQQVVVLPVSVQQQDRSARACLCIV